MNKKAIQGLIFSSGLALGALGSGLYFHNEDKSSDLMFPKKDLTSLYENVFDRNFFQRNDSPFEQMEKMSKEMDKFFDATMRDFSKVTFDDWYGTKFGGSIGDIKQEEDSNYVYYRVDLRGVDPNTIKTDVSNGQVSISGSRSDIQAEEEKGSVARSESYESFHRSFPVPAGVNTGKVEFETKDDELVIKFPKTSGKNGPMT